MNGSMRESVLSSYRAAVERASVTGSYVGNHATVAGQYLALADGDAARALFSLPTREGKFWALVASHLMAISQEDRDVVHAVSSRSLEAIEPR